MTAAEVGQAFVCDACVLPAGGSERAACASPTALSVSSCGVMASALAGLSRGGAGFLKLLAQLLVAGRCGLLLAESTSAVLVWSAVSRLLQSHS